MFPLCLHPLTLEEHKVENENDLAKNLICLKINMVMLLTYPIHYTEISRHVSDEF